MSIKSQGGVFGRNPTFNDVTVDGDLSIAGTLSVGGETITGLSYQGGWNANTNTPDIAASSPVTGQFWIVSTDGSTDVGGITNWTSGDWALFDGTNWQRVEGGNTDLTTGVTGQLAVANGGTGAADAATARTNLGLGTAATTAATDYATAAQGSLADSALQPADIGSTVQGYDANILTSSDIGSTVQGYDATILTSSDIGSTVQGYDADTAKYDDTTAAFTNTVTASSVGVNIANPLEFFHVYEASTGNDQLATQILVQNDAGYAITAGIGFQVSAASELTGYAPKAGILFERNAANGGGDLKFYNDGTGDTTGFALTDKKMEILKTGNVSITNGNLVMSTAGTGIDFSATAGTGTSELLDDYEEGTWTPTDASGAGLTFSGASGTYTKIGNVVTCHFSATYPATVNASQARISLPINCTGSGAFTLSYTTSATNFWGYPESGSSRIALTTTSATNITNANLSGIRLDGVVVYQAS